MASLGKYGSFDLGDLEDVPFGWTWEIGPPKGEGQDGEEGDAVVSKEKVDESMGAAEAEGTPAAEASASNGKKAAGKKQPRPHNRDGAMNNKTNEGPGSLRIMVGSTLSELQETNATNEEIWDEPGASSSSGNDGARLTTVDVAALKSSGLKGQALIDSLTAASSSFEKRTVFSQDKFVRRKEAKHLRLFTPLAPSLATLVEYHFGTLASGGATGQPERFRGLRLDTLAQMLSAANVGAGGRYLVVDGTSGGLIVAACLERMGGKGRLIAVHDTEVATDFECVKAMNLPPGTYGDDVLGTLNWAQMDDDLDQDDGEELPAVPEHLSLEEYPKDSPENIKLHRIRDRDRAKVLKRHAYVNSLRSLRREVLQKPGTFDGLLISTSHDPLSVLTSLLPLLAGSASFVVHSPQLQPLVEAHAALRGRTEVVNVGVTEPWTRRWQVLPGRTHPEMMTSSTGGYLLSGTRVWGEEEVQQLMAGRSAAEKEGKAEEGVKRGEKRAADEQAEESVKKVRGDASDAMETDVGAVEAQPQA